MKSELHLSEEVSNKDRRFGSALKYYPCHVYIPENGSVVKARALFTEAQIEVAMDRAKVNEEDFPEESFWSQIFG